jgi:hypothetical protein
MTKAEIANPATSQMEAATVNRSASLLTISARLPSMATILAVWNPDLV